MSEIETLLAENRKLLTACHAATIYIEKDYQARIGPAFVKGQIALRPAVLDMLYEAIGRR